MSNAVAKAEPIGVVGEVNMREEFARRISDGYKRIYRDVLAIGGMLVEAREVLAHGEFLGMLERDLPFSQRTAYNYMTEWTIANAEDLQPVANIGSSMSVRAEIERLSPEELERGLATGKLYQGVPRAEVISFRKELRTAHQHRPDALNTPAPSRPDGPGAATYGELVHLLIEWRKVRALPQSAVDHLIGCAEGQTGKYEIPHTDDGRTLTWKALFELCAVYRIGVQFVPLDAA